MMAAGFMHAIFDAIFNARNEAVVRMGSST
jgi:hypothetical protein